MKDKQIGYMLVGGLNRKIESFDERKNVAYYVLATKDDEQDNDVNLGDYDDGSSGHLISPTPDEYTP